MVIEPLVRVQFKNGRQGAPAIAGEASTKMGMLVVPVISVLNSPDTARAEIKSGFQREVGRSVKKVFQPLVPGR